jgi:hypothetical protein
MQWSVPPLPPQLGQIQGRVAQLWGTRPQFVKDNPLLVAAGGLGLVGANQALGNPVGGLIDGVMGGGEVISPPAMAYPTEIAATIPSSPSAPPSAILPQQYTLNDEDKARALTNLKRKIATDLVTIHALKGLESSD